MKPPTGLNAIVRAKRHRKVRIPIALREQVWLRYGGEKFRKKCYVSWCMNDITVFNFQCGHIQAESLGGPTNINNLVPICSRCNQSMGTQHMDAWIKFGGPAQRPSAWARLCSGIGRLFHRVE